MLEHHSQVVGLIEVDDAAVPFWLMDDDVVNGPERESVGARFWTTTKLDRERVFANIDRLSDELRLQFELLLHRLA